MALDNQFGKGIGLAAGFDLGAQKPLDSRVAVNTIAERDAHVTENRAYEGMLVYVAEANMTYQLVKGEEEGQLVWKEFGFNQADFDGAFADSIQDVDDRLKAVEEDLAQGGEIEARIAQNEADIDALQGLVGNPADADNEATGLHLALDNAKAELDQAILDEKGRAEGQEAAIRQEMADALGNYSVEADENGEGGVEAAGLRKEIEDAHKQLNADMAQAHQEMNQAMADAVAGEKERAEGQEAAIRQELADEAAEIRGEMAEQHQAMNQAAADEAARVNKKIADDIAAESALRVAEEQRIEAKLDKAVEDINKAAEDEAARVNKKIADDIAAESALRVAEEQRIEKALEDEAAAIRQELADEKAALQAEIDADVKVEKERAEGQEAAIRGEFAQADVALHATIKAEMAAVIQSLAVGIVDGKMRVALGGIEGDDVLVIREQEIDFVTDDDIDDIIAGLDAE